MQADTLSEFLEKYIEGYLFNDVTSIKSNVARIHPGSAAYPMTTTLCTGMEVLGRLLKEPPKDEKNVDAFTLAHYCKHYLSKIDERYAVFGDLARELIRNGISHSFATKRNIGITRQGGRSSTHLVRRPSDGLILINPDFLLEDFKESYTKYAKPRLVPRGDLHERAVAVYTRLSSQYGADAERVLREVEAKLADWPAPQAITYTPSLTQIMEENKNALGKDWSPEVS